MSWWFWLACVPTSDLDTAADSGAASEVSVSIEPAVAGTEDLLRAVALGVDDAEVLSWAWYRDNELMVELAETLVPSEETSAGQVWRVVLVPEFPGELDQPVSAAVVIENSAPRIDALTFPEGVGAAEGVQISVDVTDPDSDPVYLSYSWTVDGVASDETSGALPAGSVVRDQVVEVVVVPDDGELEGESTSASVTIGNSPPSLGGASFGTASAKPGDLLTVTPSGWTDADGDPEGYDFAWYVDGVFYDTGGSSSALFTVGTDHAGLILYCAVTPHDGVDSGTTVYTEFLVVEDAAVPDEGDTGAPDEPDEAPEDTGRSGDTSSDEDTG